MIYKAIEKATTKSDRYPETGKTTSSQKQQQQKPNAINISGENLGAVMEIVQSPKREGGHIIRKKESRGSTLHSNDQNNEHSKDQKGKEATSSSSSSSLPANTFLNSNFQSVNNSLLYNASLAHRDPGLHLAFARNPAGDRFAADDKKHHPKY